MSWTIVWVFSPKSPPFEIFQCHFNFHINNVQTPCTKNYLLFYPFFLVSWDSPVQKNMSGLKYKLDMNTNKMNWNQHIPIEIQKAQATMHKLFFCICRNCVFNDSNAVFPGKYSSNEMEKLDIKSCNVPWVNVCLWKKKKCPKKEWEMGHERKN